MLTTVTLTGADDSVSPQELLDLSREFPFVEWGILLGSDRAGVSLPFPRFPLIPWIVELAERAILEQQSRRFTASLSLHLCGAPLRQAAAGGFDPLGLLRLKPEILPAFGRVQLNWHGVRQQDSAAENLVTAFDGLAPWRPEIIFQFDNVNHHMAAIAIRRFRISALFDSSHGAGIKPDVWPHPVGSMHCGWAGGLGPENVVEEVQKISKIAYARPWWIDMETLLRSDDDRVFDLGRCRDVLTRIRPFVDEPIPF